MYTPRRYSRRRKSSAHRAHRNKTMKGGAGWGDIASHVMKNTGAASNNSPWGKFLTPQTSSVVSSFAKQNPKAVSEMYNSVRELSPQIRNIIKQLMPLIEKLTLIVIDKMPMPTQMFARPIIMGGLKVLPEFITMIVTHPEEAFKKFMKLNSAAKSMGISII